MILSSARFFLGLVGMLAIGGLSFLNARQRAGQSGLMRKRLMVRGAVAAVAGAILAFWLPHRIPETSGSPASLVLTLLLWVIGGGLLFLGVASFLGAAAVSPAANAGSHGPTGPGPHQ
jgi:hypothetical protein